jgi:hypothetical protein
MVGVHNGGGSSLPSGAQIPDILYTFPEEIDVHSFGDTLFYGENYNSQITVDAGQREIVRKTKGNDGNYGGSNSDKETALELVSIHDMSVGTWGDSTLSPSEISLMNEELLNNRWVIGNVFTVTYWSGHSIVIQDYDPILEEYTYWDPWTDEVTTFSVDDLLNNEIILLDDDENDYRQLAWVQYCN